MSIDLRNIGNTQLIPGATATDDASAAAAHVDGSQVVPQARPLSQVVSTAIGASPADSVVTGKTNSVGAPAAAAYNNAAPVLPNAQGAQAPVSQTAAVVANTTMFNTNPGAPISTAEMFAILQSSASTSYKLATSINSVATQAAISAKQKEVTDTVKQIEGERKAAGMSFATGILSSAAGIGVGYAGARMAKGPEKSLDPNTSAKPGPTTSTGQGMTPPTPPPSSTPTGAPQGQSGKKPGQPANASPNAQATPPPDPAADKAVTNADLARFMAEKQSKKEAFGSATAQMGQSVAGAASSAGELYNKTAGGNHEADQAKIAIKLDQVQSQIADVVKDTSKSSQDQALEAVKTAQQAVQSYSQRWTEVTNNTANR
jgi:hypothetical protein